MSAYRENLIDRLCHIYGLENPIVIEFARLCEDWEENEWNNKVLTILVEAHEAEAYFEKED